MLDDHKTRQQIYLLSRLSNDNNTPNDVILLTNEGDIINYVVGYFEKDQKELIYPSKSIAVAIIYSQMLYKYFGVNFFESLNDPNLFLGSDQYFIHYDLNKKIYNEALMSIDLELIETNKTMQVQKTLTCFHQEFFTDIELLADITTADLYSNLLD